MYNYKNQVCIGAVPDVYLTKQKASARQTSARMGNRSVYGRNHIDTSDAGIGL